MDVVVNYADDRVDARLVTGPLTILPSSSLEKKSLNTYPLYDAYDKNRETPKKVTLERIGKYEVILHISSQQDDPKTLEMSISMHGLTASTTPKIVDNSKPEHNRFWRYITMDWLILRPPAIINHITIVNNLETNIDCEILVEIHYRS